MFFLLLALFCAFCAFCLFGWLCRFLFLLGDVLLVVSDEQGGEWQGDDKSHEAIVDAETWELAQKLRKTPRRHDTLGEANPLTGLVFCADCGAKMYNHRSRGTESKPYPYDAFECSTYKLAGQKRSAACCGHHISTKALRELILETIRAASTFAI